MKHRNLSCIIFFFLTNACTCVTQLLLWKTKCTIAVQAILIGYFIQAIALRKAFINEDCLKEDSVVQCFTIRLTRESYTSLMEVVKKGGDGSYLGICKGRVVIGRQLLPAKQLGGGILSHLFLGGIQGSNKFNIVCLHFCLRRLLCFAVCSGKINKYLEQGKEVFKKQSLKDFCCCHFRIISDVIF